MQSRQAQASCEPDSGSAVAEDISAIAFNDMEELKDERMAGEWVS